MKKIKIGIIPAAGKGIRLNDLMLTRVLPKPMLPILNKPLLQFALENIKTLGAEEIFIVVGSKKQIIKEFFGDGEDFGVHITYIEQKPVRGIAHAISLTRDFIDEPFSVILGDDLTITHSLNNLLKIFWNKKAIAVEGIVNDNNPDRIKRACCIELENDKITRIIEKPVTPQSNFRGIGVYLFDPQVFDYIDLTPVSTKRNEKEITDTIGLIAEQGRAYAALINGTNINVNTSIDLLEATKLLINNSSK